MWEKVREQVREKGVDEGDRSCRTRKQRVNDKEQSDAGRQAAGRWWKWEQEDQQDKREVSR